MTTDPFAEWPPEHYHSPTEQELSDIAWEICCYSVRIAEGGTAGIIRNGVIQNAE